MVPLRPLVMVLLVAPLGCGKTKSPLHPQTEAVLTGATKVEVFRINGREDAPKSRGKNGICGYPIISRGKDQGPEFAAKLADILTDGRSYSKTYAHCFEPGVVFRVWKGEEVIDVVICYKCDNFYCGPPVKTALENGSFWHSPAKPRLVRLAKEAFPDDSEIQALVEDE
jgi:hypothetical protein